MKIRRNMLITVKMLEYKHACSERLEIFKQVWPDGVELTLDNLIKATQLNLSLDWFADNFLSGPTWEAYLKAIAPEREVHNKARVRAWKAYSKAISNDQTIAQAWEAYKQITVQAWEAYKQARVQALWLSIN